MTTTTPMHLTPPPMAWRHPLSSGRAAAALWLTARALGILSELAAVSVMLWIATVLGRPQAPVNEALLLGLLVLLPLLVLVRRRVDHAAAMRTPGSFAPYGPQDPLPPQRFFLPDVIAHTLRTAVTLTAVWWLLQAPLADALRHPGARATLSVLAAGLLTYTAYLVGASVLRAMGRRRHREHTPAVHHLHSALSLINLGGAAGLILVALSDDPARMSAALNAAAGAGIGLAAFMIAGAGALRLLFGTVAMTVPFRRFSISPTLAPASATVPPETSSAAAPQLWAVRLTEHLLLLRTGDATLEQLDRWTPLVKIAAITAAAVLGVGMVWVTIVVPWLWAPPALLLALWAWRNRSYLRSRVVRP